MTAWRHYWRESSGSLVVDIAFAWAGIAPERIYVDTVKEQHREPAFLALNPAGQIPVVVMPDGTVLTETVAILLAIDEACPQAGLLPPAGTSARALSLRWLIFLATSCYTAILRRYYSERFTTDQSPAAVSAVREAGIRDCDHRLEIFAGQVAGPFLLGAPATIVDVYAAMLADWHEPAKALPIFATLHEALMARPVVAQAWHRHESS